MPPVKSNYGKSFFTPEVTVVWSHLLKPDDKFGNPNHSVTVTMTPELQKLVAAAVKDLGGKKINGVKDTDDGRTIKFKNSQYAKKGEQKFPVVGPDLKSSDVVPFGSDVVRVKVVPSLITRDNSVSFYMDAIQLVKRNYVGESSGFKAVDGPAISDEDVPF